MSRGINNLTMLRLIVYSYALIDVSKLMRLAMSSQIFSRSAGAAGLFSHVQELRGYYINKLQLATYVAS